MSGHIIDAKCDCGFERQLMPGVDKTMAYSCDGRDLLTEDDVTVNSKGLRIIEDPFLSNDGLPDTLEAFDYRTAKKAIPQGTYLCPRCKAMGLMLRFSGYWD